MNILSMIGAVTLLGAFAYYDEQRESAAAFNDLGKEEATFAQSLADQFNGDAASLRSREQPNARLIFVKRDEKIFTTDGALVAAPALANAALPFIRLSRPEAKALGLPERSAMAGFGRSKNATIISVASAERQRDRERRAQARFYLGVTLSALVVAAFGGFAIRQQQKAETLSHALSDAQKNERLQKADRAAVLGTLAMGIAHEVGTPLGIISGRAEQLRQQLTEPRAQASAQAISEQAERIHRVVTAFLRLARGEQPNAETLRAKEIVDGAVQLAAHVCSDLQKAEIADAQVHGDRALLEQALVNLLINAQHASAVHVRIGALATNDSVEFFVSDDGAGIPPNIAARVTEPFFTTKAEGSGIGLAITSEIAKSHRGRLAFIALDKGTRASITLPRCV